MDLKNAQLDVDTWIKEHGVRYFNELTNMAQLTEEVGEVARIIARRYGEQSEKESDKNKDLGEELADVVFVVLCLANQTGIELPRQSGMRSSAIDQPFLFQGAEAILGGAEATCVAGGTNGVAAGFAAAIGPAPPSGGR